MKAIIEKIEKELKRGFTKTEFERINQLPLNSLSGILKGTKKLSSKALIRVNNYFNLSLEERPTPELKSTRIKKIVVKQDSVGHKAIKDLQESKNKTEERLKDKIAKELPQKDKDGILEGSNAFFLRHGAFYFKDLK